MPIYRTHGHTVLPISHFFLFDTSRTQPVFPTIPRHIPIRRIRKYLALAVSLGRARFFPFARCFEVIPQSN